MFSVNNIPSTTSVLSTYTAFTASAMLVRGVVGEVQAIVSQLIPKRIRNLVLSKLEGLFSNPYSQMTLVINEYEGYCINDLYEASETYLQTKISASMERVRGFKSPRDNKVMVMIHKGERVLDVHEGIELRWEMRCETKENSHDHKGNQRNRGYESRAFELSFSNKCMEKVTKSYLPYVMEKSRASKQENKVVKLHSLNFCREGDGAWGSTNLDHPATFDKLAMDPAVKKELIDDLDRFVRRREYYKRVGKAWKRGYLLYGPPGTGKSSLIAAMANYLKFDVYDLELANVYSNSELRRLLVSTKNRSMVVIEDIDCSIDLQNRPVERFESFEEGSNDKLTLSGLLNFIDGLWSSCGDERIIVFTTNHKDKLDPALLRPGRMDMHIHMSYCTPSGFRVLASNYLCIADHNLFDEIDELMMQVEVTPADVAEELMKSEDADTALKGLVKFLQDKKLRSENPDSDGREINECGDEVWNERVTKERVGGIDKIARMRKKPRSMRNIYMTRLLQNARR
ncbi:cytochrome BC1 synthesis, Outer Mitochondrial membrane protein of 66 kDa [Hibiscus trionum]|uniref:Cytochrome BC1 synthesis, Outer Mitochondrial membrane protein of 66 kDa n=1 Tax=Hibiscus trionum TaxID=183268 RepID=A0A9W7LN60_HIBTR|nr:cytochrome BC1 synthesis, Outer Mitochondrial membrane protein of 66 kDa [Hibiscus trionum]